MRWVQNVARQFGFYLSWVLRSVRHYALYERTCMAEPLVLQLYMVCNAVMLRLDKRIVESINTRNFPENSFFEDRSR